ncbi:MAG: adenylosuccinate lyase [Bacteroidales bacterium]|jgi:adenylosuccinate lyase|nr:adenylosuccinate lyase [Bacteroidales bacterium]
MLDPLMSISPVDGRYRAQTEQLADYFSEFAIIRYRVRVEIEYFIALCAIPLPQLVGVHPSLFPAMRKIYQEFTLKDASEIKATEKVTNHDVKAVEYFIKERFKKMGLERYIEFVHFGLTSQDINNTATPLSLLEGIRDLYIPTLETLISVLRKMEQEWAQVPMLARTHGQPASPTRVGKEIGVFVARLEEQKSQLTALPYSAKFGGATGNMNAHHVAYPSIDWNDFAVHFVEDILGLKRSYPTTQIEHYDNLAALFDNLKRINNILIDLCRDIWTYISMEYFRQRVKAGEVGSSAMPHKVNPIDFENAEGNLGVANALYEHLAAKLPISRMQRDLTDSTVLRNVGVPLAHSLLALKSILKGVDKLILNRSALEADLEANWAVVAEAIQTILRREAYPNPYETLKELTRGNEHISAASIAAFIDTLDVSEEVKKELRAITPHNYTGI